MPELPEPELLDPLPLPLPPVNSQVVPAHWKPSQQSSLVVQLWPALRQMPFPVVPVLAPLAPQAASANAAKPKVAIRIFTTPSNSTGLTQPTRAPHPKARGWLPELTQGDATACSLRLS